MRFDVNEWVALWEKSFNSCVVDKSLLDKVDLMNESDVIATSKSLRERNKDIATPMDLLGKSKRILIIDDDSDILEIISNGVEGFGHIPIVAGSPSEAVEIISDSRPDGMIVDLIMPTLGLAIVNNLKIPAVLYTGAPELGSSLSLVPVIGKPSGIEVIMSELYRQMASYGTWN